MYIPHRKRGYKIPIIFEFGQQNVRAGFAGKDSPDVVLPTDYLMDAEGNLKFLEYDGLEQLEGYEVKSFVSGGLIQDIDICREYIDSICTNQLKAEKDEPIFIIESLQNKRENRYKMIEMLFEDLNFSSVFFYRSQLLAEYLVARETVLVVDAGAYSTQVVPIIDGQVVEKGRNFIGNILAVIKSDFGGETQTEQLLDIWKQQFPKLSRYTNYDKLHPSVQKWGDLEVARDAKHTLCKLYDHPISYLKFNQAVDNSVYELPDNQRLEVSKEMYTIPELLFEKSNNFEGIDKMIEQSLEKVDNDYKRELIQNIILIGGVTATNNFIERLQRQLSQMKLFNLSQRAKIFAPPKIFERQHAAWIAASIVASAPIYDNRTLTRSDYEEHGSALIEKKMFY